MIGGDPMREVLSRGFGQAGPLLENDFRNVRQLREEIGRNDQVRIGHQGQRRHKRQARRRRSRHRLSSVRHPRNLRRFGAPASDVRYRRVPQRRTHLRGLRQEYQRGAWSRARPRGCGATNSIRLLRLRLSIFRDASASVRHVGDIVLRLRLPHANNQAAAPPPGKEWSSMRSVRRASPAMSA